MGVAESSAVGKVWFATFVQELAKLGWTQGGNAHFETRWTAGDADKVRAYAANLVALKPDVIAAANPGCILQIAAAGRELGHEWPIFHPVQLIDASIRGVDPRTER